RKQFSQRGSLLFTPLGYGHIIMTDAEVANPHLNKWFSFFKTAHFHSGSHAFFQCHFYHFLLCIFYFRETPLARLANTYRIIIRAELDHIDAFDREYFFKIIHRAFFLDHKSKDSTIHSIYPFYSVRPNINTSTAG